MYIYLYVYEIGRMRPAAYELGHVRVYLFNISAVSIPFASRPAAHELGRTSHTSPPAHVRALSQFTICVFCNIQYIVHIYIFIHIRVLGHNLQYICFLIHSI